MDKKHLINICLKKEKWKGRRERGEKGGRKEGRKVGFLASLLTSDTLGGLCSFSKRYPSLCPIIPEIMSVVHDPGSIRALLSRDETFSDLSLISPRNLKGTVKFLELRTQ